jgi:hypothetical protein
MGLGGGSGCVVKVEAQQQGTVEGSVDHSSTTMSDGGGSPASPYVSQLSVSQLKDCILQKRRLKQELSPDLEDAHSPTDTRWMDHDHAHMNPPPVPIMAMPAIAPPMSAPAPAPFFNWPSSNRAPPSPPALTIAPDEPALDARRLPCRQFWKAGDYEGLPGVVIRQSRSCLSSGTASEIF